MTVKPARPCKYCGELTTNWFAATCDKQECQAKRKSEADVADGKQNLWNVKKEEKGRMCGCGFIHKASERCGPW